MPSGTGIFVLQNVQPLFVHRPGADTGVYNFYKVEGPGPPRGTRRKKRRKQKKKKREGRKKKNKKGKMKKGQGP